MTEHVCTECGERATARRLCSKHYQRWRKTVDESELLRPSHGYPSLQDAFAAHPVQINANKKGCTLWLGSVTGYDPKHYGVVIFGNRRLGAHRVAWELANGRAVPPRYRVDHRCHVTLCVNPDHLRLATQKQNQEHRKGANPNSLTGHRGITYDKERCQYRARVKHAYREYHVGRFETLEEAIAAAEAKRCELFTHNDRDRAVS